MRQEVGLALGGLRDHRVRTFLTTLGVVFGVAAVISMLSISEGAKEEALAQFESLGIDNIVVMHRDPPDAQPRDEASPHSPGLSRADVRALAAVSPAITAVVPLAIAEHTIQGEQQVTATVVGTTSDLPVVRRDRLTAGRFFTAGEDAAAKRVAVIGSGLVRDLCGLREPVGSFIKIDGDWYEIIGVFAGGAGGDDDQEGLLRATDRDVCIPLNSALTRGERKRWDRELDRLVVQVDDVERLAPVADLTRRLLARRHQDVPDTEVVVPLELIRQRQATQRIFSLIMGAIAGISLLVGGIGIMNIMLASVLERTREIGIRLAMGATRSNIMRQFLVEAAAVSVFGGVMGIVLGVTLAWTISEAAGWVTVVSPFAIVLAFGVSAAVGITFGYVPARRAAGLNPIECLRYE
ncbi:ABC transporter permease [bacterium]|nr:ABC transporter permease [bacterium]